MLRFAPFERLGAGSEEQKNDFESLKAHPFFAGINFNSVVS
jgi:hypothetical protein